MENKTIAAISTPLMQSGIGIIKISGKDAISIGDKIFQSVSGKKILDSPGYKAYLGKIIGNNSQVIDTCIALIFREPKSYTGENVVEISCHGGVEILKQIYRRVIEAGATPAKAGEFTKRAYLNGKLSLTQAEGILELVSAQSKKGLVSAQAMYSNKLANQMESIKSKILEISVHISGCMDFPDEIDGVINKKIIEELEESISLIEQLIKRFDHRKMVNIGIDVVIFGSPNTGKSTIMNGLMGYERSIVTEFPGTTRDIVEGKISLSEYLINLFDTAGIRETTDAVEKIGVDRALNQINSANLVLFVFDASREIQQEDFTICELLKKTPSIAVINKIDLPSKIDINQIKKRFENVITISAKESVRPLVKKIEDLLNTHFFDNTDEIIVNERQFECLVKSNTQLKNALKSIKEGITLDAISIDVERSLSCLAELTGENVSETIIDKVFEKFCVGK